PSLSATIRRFSSVDQRRRAPVWITSSRDTFDIGVWSVIRLCLRPGSPQRKAAFTGCVRHRKRWHRQSRSCSGRLHPGASCSLDAALELQVARRQNAPILKVMVHGGIMILLKLVWDFLLHILFGSLMFGAIGSVAVGLHLLVAWTETNTPMLIATGL